MDPDEIRTLFSSAMSDMYRKEVPQYGTLIDLVREVNAEVLDADPGLRGRLTASGEIGRLDVERHGAIRLGTAGELAMIRRMFAVMGMYPVGYYDLSVAGIPVHSTAFRPLTTASLQRNPFRVFTSLLRLELVPDRQLAEGARDILNRRRIVTPGAEALIARAESEGGLSAEEAGDFVKEALETYRWHREATVDKPTYDRLHEAHRLIADVVSFRGPHINHLTPRTLDIDAVQKRMPQRGITPKAVVEGPPRRSAGILLRQTSFKALEEGVLFVGEDPAGRPGSHTARFGEIEQRGVALTPKGRALYDTLLAETRAAVQIGPRGERADAYMTELGRRFATFPETDSGLRKEGYAFFRYRAVPEKHVAGTSEGIEDLIKSGALVPEPITYEDFLPVSAAGIFQSNLGSDAQSNYDASANQEAFEEALGVNVADPMQRYAQAEKESLASALSSLQSRSIR